VAELHLEFTQLSEEVAPLRVTRSFIISCIETRRWRLSRGFGRSGCNIIVTKKEKEEIEKPADRKHRGTNSNLTHWPVRTPPLCSPYPMHRRWREAPCASWRFVMEANVEMKSLCKKATTTTSSFFLPCFSYSDLASSILHVISLLRLLVRSTAGDERGVITHHGGSVSAQIDIFIRFSKLLEHGTSTWELVSTMTVLASMWRRI
jgi:hypothetical protein